MNTTATQIIQDALVDIGVLRFGQTATTDILNGSLRTLNQMIDLWQLDKLLIFADVANIYALTPTQQIYTIGPAGANITAPRPTQISYANIVLNTFNPVVRRPVELSTENQWAAIHMQVLPNAIPCRLYYDKGFDSALGFGTLNLWPGPMLAYGLELYTWQQLQSFANLTTNYIFPPGYSMAIQKNLAVALTPQLKPYIQYQVAMEVVVAAAREALYKVKTYNSKASIMAADPAFMGDRRSWSGGWNYGTGEYNT